MFNEEQIVRFENSLFYYIVNNDNTVAITKCESNTKKVKIPEEIDNLPVVTIDRLAFFSSKVLREVTIPKYVNKICFRAFADCTALRKINFTDSLEIIEESAFEGCTALRGISLPSTLKRIEQDAFSFCEALKFIDFPASVKALSKRVFKNTALEEIIIPDGIKIVSNRAFENCNNLKKIYLPYTVFAVENNAFYNCLSLEEIDVAIDNNTYKTENGALYKINGDEITLVVYPSGKTDDIIRISNITTTIGELAFYKTKGNIISLPESVSKLSPKSFFGIAAEEVNLPGSIKELESAVFTWCENLKRVKIEEGLQDLNLAAFYCCDNLSSVFIPDSVNKINSENCDLPENLTFFCTYDSYAYKELKKLGFKVEKLKKEKTIQEKEPQREDIAINDVNHTENLPEIAPEQHSDVNIETDTNITEKPSESIVEENKEETEEEIIVTYTNGPKSENNKDSEREEVHSEEVPVQQDETSSVNDSDLFDLNFADDNSSVDELGLVDDEVITPDEFIPPVVDEETIRINKDVDEDLLIKKENEKEQAVTELMDTLSLGEKSAEEDGWVPLEEVENELVDDDNTTVHEETVIENEEKNNENIEKSNENIEESNESSNENVNEEKQENQERVSEEVTEENNDEEDDDALIDLYIDLDSL